MNEGCEMKTTLVSRIETYRFAVKLFELMKAFSTFHGMKGIRLAELLFFKVYLDDDFAFSSVI